MKKKRTYQAAHVDEIDVDALVPQLTGGCIVALDVAKRKYVAALATLGGEVIKLLRFEHPTETRRFMAVVDQLQKAGLPKLIVAMEPTGTYGDAVRMLLVDTGVPVHMVSPKRTHDSQELFDNVRSLHDPKSAVLVAKLCAMGLSTEWTRPPESRTRLRALVDLRQHEHEREQVCFGRLEARLARHWPEYGQWFDVHKQRTALRLLAAYPSPARITAASDEATRFVHSVSRGTLKAERAEGLIDAARRPLGVSALPEEEAFIRTLATEAIAAMDRGLELEEQMRVMTAGDDAFKRLAKWMGVYTAAVLVTMCDPRQYTSSRQLEKACGLNLREKSSGEHRGKISITKRGPGVVRFALFMFALRMIRDSDVVRAWYMRRNGYTNESRRRAVIAVTRKLVKAAFHVARGSEFDATKLFDTRRLDLEDARAKRPRNWPRNAAGREERRSDTTAHASN